MRIGLVEFLLILAIASLTIGPQVALFVDRWLRRANRVNARAARRRAEYAAQAAAARDALLKRFRTASTVFGVCILLALVFISLLGFGKYNVILALGVAFVPSYARVIRSEFARHREMNYVKSARLMGAGHLRIMFLHILPNTRQVLLPTLVIGFNNAVLAEASMSYLGIGVKPPDVSLGYMLSESQSYMARAPWYMLTVGGVIVLLIFGVSLLGEGLQQKEWGR